LKRCDPQLANALVQSQVQAVFYRSHHPSQGSTILAMQTLGGQRPARRARRVSGQARRAFRPGLVCRHPPGPGAHEHRGGDEHWRERGTEEGRQSNANFSIAAYRDRHEDLQGFSLNSALGHWWTNGQAEGRDATP